MLDQERPVIFGYQEYRSFLKDYFVYLKNTKPGFSHRYIAKHAGFGSPSFFKMIIEGKRNLTTKSILQLMKAMPLSQSEKNYLRALVNFNQSTNIKEREQWADALLGHKEFKKVVPEKSAPFNYFAKWYYIPIRELVMSKDFQESPEWISRKLNPRISPLDAELALKDLIQIGMLKRDANTGKLHQAEPVAATLDEVSSIALVKYHRQMIRMGADAIVRVPKREREISSAAIFIAPERVEEYKSLVRKFLDQVVEMAEREKTDAGRVFQVAVQLFPLTENSQTTDKAPLTLKKAA